MAIQLLEEVAVAVRPPRALLVPFPHGYPLHRPSDPAAQIAVLAAALDLLRPGVGPAPVLARYAPPGG